MAVREKQTDAEIIAEAHEGAEAKAMNSFTGELLTASEDDVTLAADGGVVTIPYSEIRRSNLVEE